MLQRVQSEGLSRKRFGTSLPGGQSPRYRARAARDRAAGIAVRVFQASDHSVEPQSVRVRVFVVWWKLKRFSVPSVLWYSCAWR